jgi:hypothetical protein
MKVSRVVEAWLEEQLEAGASRIELWRLSVPLVLAAEWVVGESTDVKGIAMHIMTSVRAVPEPTIGYGLFAYGTQTEEPIALARVEADNFTPALSDSQTMEETIHSGTLRSSELYARLQRDIDELAIERDGQQPKPRTGQ